MVHVCLCPLVKVSRNAVELSSSTYHFELSLVLASSVGRNYLDFLKFAKYTEGANYVHSFDAPGKMSLSFRGFVLNP